MRHIRGKMSLLNKIPEPEMFAEMINYTDSMEMAKALLLTSKHFSKIISSVRSFITIDLSYERFKNNDLKIEGHMNEIQEQNIHGLIPENSQEIIIETILPAGNNRYNLIDFQDLGYIITSCIVSSNFREINIVVGGIKIFTLTKYFVDILQESFLDLMYFLKCLPYGDPHYHEYWLDYSSNVPIQLKIVKKRWVEQKILIRYRTIEYQTFGRQLSCDQLLCDKSFEIRQSIRHIIKGIFFKVEYDNKINNEILQNIIIKIGAYKSYKITADLLKCDDKKNIVPMKAKNCYYFRIQRQN